MSRFMTEMHKYEVDEKTELPEKLKVRLLLRRATLNSSQRDRMETWAGRDAGKLVTNIELLNKLDHPRYKPGNVSATMYEEDKTFYEDTGTHGNGADWTGAATSSAWLGQEGSRLEYDSGEYEESYYELGPEADDLQACHYMDSTNDVGEDSCSETSDVYVHVHDLSKIHEEADVLQTFAGFREVKQRLQNMRKNRGFFPTDPLSNSSKGASKGYKGKGKKGKGKGKGKGYRRFGPRSWNAFRQRDERRRQQGIVRVPKDAIYNRTKSFSCHQVGHISRHCPNKPSTSSSAASSLPTSFGPKPQPKTPASFSSTGAKTDRCSCWTTHRDSGVQRRSRSEQDELQPR